MENIVITQINKEKSDENSRKGNSLLVFELSSNPSEHWHNAFERNAKSISSTEKQFFEAKISESDIYVRYKHDQKKENAFKQMNELVNKTNQTQSEFDSWIDKTNLILKNQNHSEN